MGCRRLRKMDTERFFFFFFPAPQTRNAGVFHRACQLNHCFPGVTPCSQGGFIPNCSAPPTGPLGEGLSQWEIGSNPVTKAAPPLGLWCFLEEQALCSQADLASRVGAALSSAQGHLSDTWPYFAQPSRSFWPLEC